MNPQAWGQINIAFPDWAKAEHTAVAHLAPLLLAAEDGRLLSAWFFIRKTPCWRIRYQPRNERTQAYLRHHLDDLIRQGHLDEATEVIYEPEQHAFGGPEAMACAHTLFHLDSRHLLTHLAHSPRSGHRRELSLLLCTTMLRSAGLDWYEQGDVWARVADHRGLPPQFLADRRSTLEAGVRRLMSVDATALLSEGASLAFAAAWSAAFSSAGHELADLATRGLLHRGMRAVLAHQVIFAWNRLGLPYRVQAALSHTAKQVVFGSDPTITPATRSETR